MFKYAKYLSRHNHNLHWVDDVNNMRHDNIGLEHVWHKKWWPTLQITFICSVAEATAVYSRACGRKTIPEPQLEVCRTLSLRILENNLYDKGVSINSPICHKKRSIGPGSSGHELVIRHTHNGM